MFGSFSRKPIPTVATDNKHLRKLVLHNMDRHGARCDLNHIDVSGITDFSGIFANTAFDGDISRWDTSSAINMTELFAFCPFNGDISKWSMSKVELTSRMFFQSPFQGHIADWDVSNVRDMHSMFAHALFNGDISGWDTGNVTTMSAMFMSSAFTKDISRWNVKRVVDMSMMFHNSYFAGDVSRWDMASLKHATHIFDSAYFESDLPVMELQALISGSSMLSAAFRGRLDRTANDYDSVRRMFPNAIATHNYLGYIYRLLGPGAIHIDYALQQKECPSWFDPDIFAWVKHEQGVCMQMGMNVQAIRELVKNDFLQGGANPQRAESIPFEFEAVRSSPGSNAHAVHVLS